MLLTKTKLNLKLSYYDEILNSRIVYYQELTKQEKERFLLRVYRFKKSKRFHYTG